MMQNIVLALIVLAAAAYLFKKGVGTYRSMTKKTGGCSHCGCGEGKISKK